MGRRTLVKAMKTKCRTVAGRMLREYRIRLGLPSAIVARQAGLTPTKVCKIETGNHAAQANQLLALLAQIEATPGEVDRLLKQHKQLKGDYTGRTVKDAFDAITELDKRMAYLEACARDFEEMEERLLFLETALGVTSDDED